MFKNNLLNSFKSITIPALAIVFASSIAFSSLASADTAGSNGYIWGTPHSVDGQYTTKVEHNSPTTITGIPNQVVQVVSTNTDYYALDNTGAVWSWGADKNGQLGTGSTPRSTYTTTPVQVQFPAGVTIASLPNPMPDGTAMATDTNGDEWGWGYNNSNQLCVRGENITAPVQVPLSNVTLASGAGDHALYYSNGTLYACGGNAQGDLGTNSGSTYTKTSPEAVVGLPTENIMSLTTSYHNSGALMADGSYYDWGFNKNGQLGDGNTKNSSKPVLVSLPQTATQVSVGGSLANNGQTIALLSDGSVYMWGNNSYGQLGNGTTTNALTPTAVDIPAGVTFDFVNSGGSTAYAIDTTGNSWAWGQNNLGQIGDGQADSNANSLPISLNVQMSEISATSANVIGL
jgi:alpha-tubulin suppressor-like RCC1 family protein